MMELSVPMIDEESFSSQWTNNELYFLIQFPPIFRKSDILQSSKPLGSSAQ